MHGDCPKPLWYVLIENGVPCPQHITRLIPGQVYRNASRLTAIPSTCLFFSNETQWPWAIRAHHLSWCRYTVGAADDFATAPDLHLFLRLPPESTEEAQQTARYQEGTPWQAE
ncbi:MAG: hypothetical protein CSA33_08250 [Desulfobulbus propionicus]|nr:MAG: hypothetical protein CSA33_08250 [Desulfobulbus propionicus]